MHMNVAKQLGCMLAARQFYSRVLFSCWES